MIGNRRPSPEAPPLLPCSHTGFVIAPKASSRHQGTVTLKMDIYYHSQACHTERIFRQGTLPKGSQSKRHHTRTRVHIQTHIQTHTGPRHREWMTSQETDGVGAQDRASSMFRLSFGLSFSERERRAQNSGRPVRPLEAAYLGGTCRRKWSQAHERMDG